MVSIVDAMTDPNLFGETFGGDSFSAWRALLSAFYGLDMSDEDLETVKSLTGRQSFAEGGFRELWVPVGRRGGKSHVAALVGVYEAAFRDYRPKLSPGEVATVMLLAADRAQARTLLRYVQGLFDHPMLRPLVKRETAQGLELTNRVVIEVATATYRTVRGYTLAAVILDEIAFWMADGASPDVEIVAALRPALATLDGRLIGISSPYARRGVLWDVYRRAFGNDDENRALVAQAPSRTMNPTIAESVVEAAMAEDASRARAEWLAEFRTDIAMLLDADLIRDCTRPKPRMLPPVQGTRYLAFVDPSGGGADEFTISIGHLEGRHVIVDLVEGRSGSPAETVAEFVKLMTPYGVKRVMGDRYAGRWPRDEFKKHGIGYEVSEQNRSEVYLEMLAALNSGRVELPPDQKMERQLIALERRTSRSGRDSIDHPPGGHDDRANAVAGVVAYANGTANRPIVLTGLQWTPAGFIRTGPPR
ncbi:hypothetical protein OEZ71_09830 [Defluviimonas sp. WL0050]|uniref:Phage terminase large subunit-like protein n=1 Tax=Albidovulum litorale TaxID=2984134 RepID=A0ABT2ZNK5_9RHOB|nr:hypothetical protein [Defluviimonas sp. WL0050]MCV2872598.1 hypothetical protein [Defluviimonas sp. WL0050]